MKQNNDLFSVLSYEGVELPYKIQGEIGTYDCKILCGTLISKETFLLDEVRLNNVLGITHKAIGTILFARKGIEYFFSNAKKECEFFVALLNDPFEKDKTEVEIKTIISSTEFNEKLKDCNPTQKDLLKSIYLNIQKILNIDVANLFESSFFYRDINLEFVHEYDFGTIVYTVVEKENSSKQKFNLKSEINYPEGRCIIIDVIFKNDIVVPMFLQTNNEVNVYTIHGEKFENEIAICQDIENYLNGKISYVTENMQLISEDSVDFYLMRDEFIKMNTEIHDIFTSERMNKLRDFFASDVEKFLVTDLYKKTKTKELKTKIDNYNEFKKIKKRNVKMFKKIHKAYEQRLLESEYMIV